MNQILLVCILNVPQSKISLNLSTIPEILVNKITFGLAIFLALKIDLT